MKAAHVFTDVDFDRLADALLRALLSVHARRQSPVRRPRAEAGKDQAPNA